MDQRLIVIYKHYTHKKAFDFKIQTRERESKLFHGMISNTKSELFES